MYNKIYNNKKHGFLSLFLSYRFLEKLISYFIADFNIRVDEHSALNALQFSTMCITRTYVTCPVKERESSYLTAVK